jgi:hypothetical protein
LCSSAATEKPDLVNRLVLDFLEKDPQDIHAAETTMFAADRQIIWTERPQAQAEALDFSNWRLRAERGGSELDLLCISVELMDSIGLLHSSRP